MSLGKFRLNLQRLFPTHDRFRQPSHLRERVAQIVVCLRMSWGSIAGANKQECPSFTQKGRTCGRLIDGLRSFLTLESFHHPVERSSVDPENFCGAAHVSIATFDHVADVLAFNLLKGNQIP